jgi:RHS repeat-associated protein
MWKHASPILLTVLGLYAYAANGQQTLTQVTTTTYQRNADGALTAVTTRVDNQPATTTYLTWDNFLPNVSNPTTGTVSAGNGNLLGYGPSPGGAYATQLQFDQRNRLTAATVAGATGVNYSYYAASRMASATLTSGDALQFYYDTAQNQVATNIHQASTGTWSSYLDQTTYLSDGTEQVRLQPRKDVCAQYEAAAQNLSPVAYDPYGTLATPATAPPTSTYDMAQNPFQYAGEFRDPVWGGYYLRARWYLPDLQTFVSRDPGDPVRRYSYANGNPVGNVDPSGLRSGYQKHVGNFLGRLLKPLTTGAQGFILPLFIGTELTPLEILANPGQFWHSVKNDSHGTDIFLAATVLAEGGDEVARHFFNYAISFRTQVGLGAAIGVAQSIAAGDNGAHRRFGWTAFGQSLSYAANSEATVRYADERLHFQPRLGAAKVNEAIAKAFEDEEADAVVFRGFAKRPSGPIEEWWHQVRGEPDDVYEVTVSRDTVRISGPDAVWGSMETVRPYDPSLSAFENIKTVSKESFGVTLRGFEDPTTFSSMRDFIQEATEYDELRRGAYAQTKISGERPEPRVISLPGSISARLALSRMLSRLGLE